MWTSKISQFNRLSNGKIEIVITYNDGISNFDEKYPVNSSTYTLDDLKKSIREKIKELNAIDAFIATLNLGDMIAPMPDDVVVPPTQEELDQEQFLKDYRLWVKVKYAIDAGVLNGTEPQVVALKSKVQSEFKPAYLNLL